MADGQTLARAAVADQGDPAMTEMPRAADALAPPRPAQTGGRGRADLAALIAARICHDLVNPLGAIGNGVELLTLTGQGSDAEMDLIVESVANDLS